MGAMPSRSTLQAIATTLRLTPAEMSFAFAVAGLVGPPACETLNADRSAVLDKLILTPDHVAICVLDAYLTPLRWNAVADAIYQFSCYDTPLARSLVTRLADPYFVGYYGAYYEDVTRQLVGMFRRAYTFHRTSLASEIYDVSKDLAIFRRFWDEHTIADEAEPSHNRCPREHPIVGTVWIQGVDLSMPHSSDLVVWVVAPADEASFKKFERLRIIGTASLTAEPALLP